MLLVVSVFLAGFLQSICLVVGVGWLVRREKRAMADRLDALQHEWLDHDEGQPHKLAQAIDAAGAVVGSAAARSIMASLGADASHAARAANGAADVMQAQQNPLLSLLAGGKRGKGAAVMRLAEMLGPMLSGAGNHNGNGAPPGDGEYTGRRHRD
jgi:hypothetical protein